MSHHSPPLLYARKYMKSNAQFKDNLRSALRRTEAKEGKPIDVIGDDMISKQDMLTTCIISLMMSFVPAGW
jgi:hypothetical protein